MSETVPIPSTTGSPSAAGDEGGPTAGQLLRQAREAEGLHIAALAVALKVPVKKLEALESDRFDLLSDLVFARALAGSVCRVLKVDPAPILARFPTVPGTRLWADEAGINQPFKGSAGPGLGPRVLEMVRKPLSIAIVLLVIATVVLWVMPLQGWRGATSAPSPTVAEPAAVASAQVASPVGNSTVPANSADVKPVQIPPAAPATTLLPAEAAQGPVLQIHARGESWVEVVDAKGIVQLRRVVRSAERIALSGPTPLSVVLGRAGNVEVVVRGKVVDVSASTRDNVARFEVK